jgi:RNA polymerase sigma-70 factor (ECF subfamily)
MIHSGNESVRAGLPGQLASLWRYGLVLSGNRQTAEDLVQATCVRALERSGQFTPGTRLDHWLRAILRSIWLNDLRAQRLRQGAGWVPAEDVLVFDGADAIETNILATQVLRQMRALPEAQRETLYLVYGEGLTYAEAAEALDIPVGTVMSRLAAGRARLASLADEAKEQGRGQSRENDAGR